MYCKLDEEINLDEEGGDELEPTYVIRHLKQLQLPIEKHSSPYIIGCIKATEKIEVKERCKISSSIGKYQAEIYYDIVNMNACHLLLGRPRQFDVNS